MSDVTALKVRMRKLLEGYRSTLEGIKADRFLVCLDSQQSEPKADGFVDGHLSGDEHYQSFTIDELQSRCQELDSEIQKVNRLEMVVAVVGTVKAGKSTAINALVGTELTPSRNSPMTTVPTLVRHNAALDEPELEFQNPEPLGMLIAEIKEALESASLEAFFTEQPECRSLAEQIGNGSLQGVRSSAVGSDSIGQVLAQVNDLARLARALGLSFPYHEYNEMAKYPVVSVRFSGLQGVDSGGGSFALLDTPGPNELGHSQELQTCLTEQLSRSSAILTVMDYTQVNSEADGQMRDQVRGVLGKTHGLQHLYALLNKYDQRSQHDIGEDEQKQRVLQLFSVAVTSEDKEQQLQEFEQQIFLAAGKPAFLATWVLRQLQQGTLNADDGWTKEYLTLQYGRSWNAATLADSDALEQGAQKELQESGFADLGGRLVQRGYAQAAANALNIASVKLRSNYRELTKFLNSKKGTLEQEAARAAYSQQQRNSQLEQQSQTLEQLEQASLALVQSNSSQLKQIGQQVVEQFSQQCQLIAEHLEGIFTVDQETVYSPIREDRRQLQRDEQGQLQSNQLGQPLENRLERKALLSYRWLQRLYRAGGRLQLGHNQNQGQSQTPSHLYPKDIIEQQFALQPQALYVDLELLTTEALAAETTEGADASLSYNSAKAQLRELLIASHPALRCAQVWAPFAAWGQQHNNPAQQELSRQTRLLLGRMFNQYSYLNWQQAWNQVGQQALDQAWRQAGDQAWDQARNQAWQVWERTLPSPIRGEQVANKGAKAQPTEGPLTPLLELTGWTQEQIDVSLLACTAFIEWQQQAEVPELLLEQILATAPAFKERFGSYYHSSAEGTQEDLSYKLLDIFETWQKVFAQEVIGEAFALAQQLLEQYRAPFERLLTEQLGGNGPSPSEDTAEHQPEDGAEAIAPTPIEGWMLPQFSTPPITFEGKANQRAKGVMKQDPSNHDITFSLEKLKENMQAIQQQFETEAKRELEQYFSNAIPQLVQQHFATCRTNIQQNYSEFMQAQSQQAQEQMRDEILASVHRVEEQLEQQQQEFDSLQNELNKL